MQSPAITTDICFIYALCDPWTEEVRYIGKTKDITKRMYCHFDKRQLVAKTKKNEWLKSLIEKQQKPVIKILAAVWYCQWERHEQRYIAAFRSLGSRITNETDGGAGGLIPKIKGVPRTQEVKDKISRKHKGKTVSQEMRERIRKALTGYKHTEQAKKNMLVGLLKNWTGERGEKRRVAARKRLVEQLSKPIIQMTLTGEIIAQFKNARIACQQTGVGYKLISRVCKGQRKTAHGFTWKFADKSRLNQDLALTEK